MRRIPRRSWTLGLLAALATVALLPASLEAQARGRSRQLRADGEPAWTKKAKPERQFSLFGLADAAYSDIKASNRKYYWQTCNFNGSLDCDSWGWSSQGTFTPAYMYTSWAIATPPSVRDTIMKKVGAPAAGYATAMGGGWNVQFNESLNASDVLLPADGQLGQYMSGAAATADKTCRDHTHDLSAGTPLLATSDCPETWGPLGWQGRRPVSEGEFLASARADPANFKFDFWTIPSGEPDPSGKLDRFFGSFQTYGFISDYSKEEVCGGGTLRTFGRVAKGLPAYATCPDIAPSKPGYPIGIEIRFDAFTYGIPALSDVIYYQATVTNKSGDLFGVGVDYDSLYVGPMPAYYSTTQLNQVYMRPDNGTFYGTAVCSHQTVPLCNGAATVADLRTSGVTSTAVGGLAGGAFEWGTTAFTVLKSPIGDLRNKLFSRPTSPFSTVAVPANFRDDTITVSHGHMCGFRACTQQQFVLSYDANPDATRRAFGMISSTERNAMGVRTDPCALGGSVSGQILWHIFRSADWPACPPMGTAPNQFPQTGGFNRWSPPGWDWNEDGVQDTLYYDTCSNKGPGDKTTLAGACVGIFSDTMPHSGPDASTRWINGYANVAGAATVGPISLKAGESVGFTFSMTSACCGAGVGDSLAIQAKVKAAIDHYMNFYLGPEPLPRDTIVAAEVIGGNETVSRVTLVFTETAENSRDPFLLNLAANLTIAQPGTPDFVLRSLNPTLIDSLISTATPFGLDTAGLTAAGNFDKKYVFKSCDGGNTWTNNANCAPSPAVGGTFAALGWLPYATLERDPVTGDLPNTFTDDNVFGGTTYTYVLIGASRGANYILQTGDAFTTITVAGEPRNVCTANCATRVVSFAPSLFNALSTSGPNTRSVYVPASAPAGSARSLVTIRTTAGPVEQSAVFVTPASDTPVPGTYSLTFYDSVRVIVRDSLDADGKVRLGTTSTVDAWKGSPAVVTRFGSVKVGGVGLKGSTIRSAFQSGPIRIVEHFFSGTIAVLNGPNGAVLVTNDLTESATPETFFSSTAFPGFTLGFNALTPLAYNTIVGEQFVVGGKVTNELTKPFVKLRLGNTTVGPKAEGGRYRITWDDKPFGPGEPFRIDPSNPQRTDSAVRASLLARTVAQTAIKTPAVAAVLGGGTDTSDLVALKLPFTIFNESFQRPVQVAFRKRTSNVIRFGRLGDTASVNVPADQWIPGDQLILLEDVGAAGGGDSVTFTAFTLGCDPGLATYAYCNPIALLTPGGSNWITTKDGTVQTVLFNPRITTAQQFTVTVAAPRTGDLVGAADLKTSIKSVRAVPNPYVAFTNYINPRDPGNRTRPLLFTHVPPRGRIRVYTVSGQLVQQLSWTPADLNETGDLIWDLRTREGLDVAGGLYMFMVTGLDANGKELASHLGKFVIVR